MDFKILKRLVTLVENSAINELEVEQADLKVRIKKAPNSSDYPTQVMVTPAPVQPMSLPAPQEGPQVPQVEEGVEEIVSPMVGTFYSCPTPGKPSYVERGSEVKKGDILCIIEAMKLMNEIESPYDGKIIDILVNNAQPVEFGEKLFRIKPKK